MCEQKTLTKKSNELRTKLMDSAEDLFTTQGVNSTSVREIGRGAGINHSVIFRIFKSKQGLVDAVHQRLMADETLLVFFQDIPPEMTDDYDSGSNSALLKKLGLLSQFLIQEKQTSYPLFDCSLESWSIKTERRYGEKPTAESMAIRLIVSIAFALGLVYLEGGGKGEFKQVDIKRLRERLSGLLAASEDAVSDTITSVKKCPDHCQG